jgi:hypothetical protein
MDRYKILGNKRCCTWIKVLWMRHIEDNVVNYSSVIKLLRIYKKNYVNVFLNPYKVKN